MVAPPLHKPEHRGSEGKMCSQSHRKAVAERVAELGSQAVGVARVLVSHLGKLRPRERQGLVQGRPASRRQEPAPSFTSTDLRSPSSASPPSPSPLTLTFHSGEKVRQGTQPARNPRRGREEAEIKHVYFI